MAKYTTELKLVLQIDACSSSEANARLRRIVAEIECKYNVTSVVRYSCVPLDTEGVDDNRRLQAKAA